MKLRLPIILIIFTVLIAFIVPFFADIYIYSVITTILIWIMMGQAWNLLSGFTGQISFGHAMFLGVGAYTSMLLVNNSNLDMSLSIILGGLLAGLLSIPIGLLIFRLRGPYFALGTLAFAEIMLIVARNLKSVTNGGEGIMLATTPKIFGMAISSKEEYFFVALILAAVITYFCYHLMRTKTGYTFIAIRENQDAAESMGINSTKAKSLALFISSFLAGVGGAFYGLYNKFIDPDMTFTVTMSVEMIFVTIAGGIGTVLGPVIGSTILISLQEYLKSAPVFEVYSSLYLVVYGLLIMVIIVYLPGGIVDGVKKIIGLFKKKGDKT